MSRFLLHSAAVWAVLTVLSGAVSAHARPTHAEPTPGRTVKAPPTQVIMDFSEVVEPRFSSITVQDAQRQRVDKGDVHVAPDNPKRLVVDLKLLEPGKYKVIWHAVSVDTHSTEGTYVFGVGP
jgi:methionine-rich copper-binding protein CopC